VALETGFQPLPFDEAIDYFRQKTSVSPERFRLLSAEARKKAFTIAGSANRQVRDSIKDLLDRALSEGLTLKDFQEDAADVLDAAGLAPQKPWDWETVYRTNMQTSYQAGRWQQMTDPDVVAVRPYLRYVSALLPTTRASHREKHGLIYPADDPFWNIWYPPNGFNCYCTVQSVSESLLKRRGWTVSAERNFQYPDPDSGFAGNAGKTESV
jgi:SPP1 gp7 family putative phage head morphogenesis protein